MTTPPFDSSATEPFQPAPPEPGPVPGSMLPPGPMPVTEPVMPRTAVRGSGNARLLNIALGAALLIAAAGVAFAVGRATAPAGTTSGGTAALPGNLGGNGFGNGGNGFRGNGYFPGGFEGDGGRGFGIGGLGGGLTIQGTVDSVTGDSVTIKLASGQTITVGLSSDTTYHQQADATASDVQSGKTVILRLSGGFRPNGTGGANGNGNGSITLGTASDVTVVP